MAVITLASATGAPGVTTTAAGLAFVWPRDILLVDADRDAGQALLAGLLRGHDAGGRGLTRLDFDSAAGPDDLLANSIELAPDPEHRRYFLPGFPRPSSATSFEPVWASLGRGLRQLDDVGFDAIVDAGRIRDGLAPGLMVVTDLLLVVVRATLRSLAGVRVHLAALADAASERGTDTGLVVIGAGEPYSAADISDQFGWPVRATIAADPAAAQVLSEGASHRRYRKTAFCRSLDTSARQLGADIRHRVMEGWS